MAWSLTLPPPSSLSSSSSPSFPTFHHHHHSLFFNGVVAFTRLRHRRTSNTIFLVPSVGKEDTDLRVSSLQEQQLDDGDDDNDEEPTPQDLEYVAQIKRVSLFFILLLVFFPPVSYCISVLTCRFWSFSGKTGTWSSARYVSYYLFFKFCFTIQYCVCWWQDTSNTKWDPKVKNEKKNYFKEKSDIGSLIANTCDFFFF